MPRARLLTPLGEAALAVIALEGSDVGSWLAARGAGPPPPRGRPSVRRLALPGGGCEACIVLAREDAIEVHVHGNPVLVRQLLAGCEAADPRPRDLADEILAAATRAPTRGAMRACLTQLTRLADLAAALARAGPRGPLRLRVAAAIAAGHRLRPLLVPPRVVLRGRTNAGKSTLFNLLVGRERVRTGPERALTRDPVEETVVVAGRAICVVDTAGEGAPLSPLDARAQDAARGEGARGLSVWLCAVHDPGPHPDPAPGSIRIWTHAGRGARPVGGAGEPVVDLLAAGRTDLRLRLGVHLVACLGLPSPDEPWGAAWVTERQGRCLREAAAALAGGTRSRIVAAARALLDAEH